MAPPPREEVDDVADDGGGLFSALRAAASDENDEGQDMGGGYDSDEENRRGVNVARRKSKKGADDGGEENDGLGDGNDGKNKQVVGKNKVEKIIDPLGQLVQRSFLKFLKSSPYYLAELERMKDHGRSGLYVDFSHLNAFDLDLATMILDNYYQFKPDMEKALQVFVGEQFPDYLIVHDRTDSKQREFQICFHNLDNLSKVRDLHTESLGRLISVTGTVTRSSETRPELLIGAFRCLACGSHTSGVEQEFKYTEPLSGCSCDGGRGWELDVDRSTFVDWQKLRVQENANEVPAGSMPRSIEIIVRHEAVEQAKPGDKCYFTGTLIVVPDVSKLRAPGDPPGLKTFKQDGRRSQLTGEDAGVTGIASLGVRDLTYRLAFLACTARPCDGSGMVTDPMDETGELTREESRRRVQETFTEEEREQLERMRLQPNLMEAMKRSVAPAIYGHADVKLGVLLLLFGGVHKRTKEGINLRGDINVCIVGDPSTAKSQFLRYVCGFAPRAVYTSGKASTAAGLTASVLRDPETGEFCIEAGALMLADNGVCCIDEFDKMDDVDQVAIHEAMEQQTISITKAGIQATLNARTSVLAAANPIHGRYDRSKTLKANLTVGPAIMSRFDLFFVVLDECDEVNDRSIADHIVEVHRKRLRAADSGEAETAEDLIRSTRTTFSSEQMRKYVRYARTIDPILTPEVQPLLVNYYVKLRQGDSGVGQNKQAYRITVRQLEALIRLSEAIARMHLDEKVREEYVEIAYTLLKTSIVQVESETISVQQHNRGGDDEGVDEVDFDPSFHVRGDAAEVVSIEEIILDYMGLREEASQQEQMTNQGVQQTDIVVRIFDKMQDAWPDNEEATKEKRQLVNQIIASLMRRRLLNRTDSASYPFEDNVPDEERRLLVLAKQQIRDQSISQRVLQKIAQHVKQYVSHQEQTFQDNDEFLGVPQTEIVDEVISEHMIEFVGDDKSEEGVQRARDVINGVIDRLVHVEHLLIEKILPYEYSFQDDIPEEEQRLLGSINSDM